MFIQSSQVAPKGRCGKAPAGFLEVGGHVGGTGTPITKFQELKHSPAFYQVAFGLLSKLNYSGIVIRSGVL